MSVIEKAVAILRQKQAVKKDDKENIASEHDAAASSDEGDSASNLVCQLDFDALKEAGYITNGEDNTQLAEEYRIIKRPLLANAFGKGVVPVDMGNMIMITSAVPGEGKTFTSINLALSMALERDTTVLLVDIDVVNPRLSKLFGLGEQPGLLDVVNDKSLNLADVIINTDNPKLRVIPAGLGHEHSTEILASDRMAKITEELSQRYRDRILLFDAPPLLNTTQAKVLTRYMGQIMVVVEAGMTHKSAVVETIDQLKSNKVVGMILNKCKISKSNIYGGYYGTYGE